MEYEACVPDGELEEEPEEEPGELAVSRPKPTGRRWKDAELWKAFREGDQDAQHDVYVRLVDAAHWEGWRAAALEVGWEPYELAERTFTMLAESPSRFDWREGDDNRSLQNYLTTRQTTGRKPQTSRKKSLSAMAIVLSDERKKRHLPDVMPLDRPLGDTDGEEDSRTGYDFVAQTELPQPDEDIAGHHPEDPIQLAEEFCYISEAERIGLLAAGEFRRYVRECLYGWWKGTGWERDLKARRNSGELSEEEFKRELAALKRERADYQNRQGEARRLFAAAVFPGDYDNKTRELAKKRAPAAEARLELCKLVHGLRGVESDGASGIVDLLVDCRDAGWISGSQLALLAGDAPPGFMTDRDHRASVLESSHSNGPPIRVQIALVNVLAACKLGDFAMSDAYQDVRSYAVDNSRLADSVGLGFFANEWWRDSTARLVLERTLISGLSQTLMAQKSELADIEMERVGSLAGVTDVIGACSGIEQRRWSVPGVSVDGKGIRFDGGGDGPEETWDEVLDALGFKPTAPDMSVSMSSPNDMLLFRETVLRRREDVLALRRSYDYGPMRDFLATVKSEADLRNLLIEAVPVFLPGCASCPKATGRKSHTTNPSTRSEKTVRLEMRCEVCDKVRDPAMRGKTLNLPGLFKKTIEAEEDRAKLLKDAGRAEMPPISFYERCEHFNRKYGRDFTALLRRAIDSAQEQVRGGDDCERV